MTTVQKPDDIRAVVTGAASGLGLAVVTRLATDGAEVIGLDLPGDDRRAAVEAAGADFLACDVSDDQSWAQVAMQVEKRLGTVTLLALNAGVMTRSADAPIDDDPLSLAGGPGYRRAFAVNVDGVVFGMARLRPLLAPGASVTVTASVAGISALAFDPYYAMTKHAVVGFVRSMAEPLAASRVRINALCPGGIDTAIVPEAMRSLAPTSAFRSPSDVARSLLAVADLTSSGGTWVPGDDGAILEYTVPPRP